MSILVWLFAGLTAGGCITTLILSCMQIKIIQQYEQEIRKLRQKLNKEI